MNYTTEITSLSMIDLPINDLQTILYNKLDTLWTNIDGFGKTYRNKKGGDSIKYIAEVYLSNGEYRDVYFDDGKNGSFFFLVGDEFQTEDEEVFTADVKIVFMMNLQSVYNTRNDAKAHNDVIDIITTDSSRSFEITGIQTGINKIMQGYDTENLHRLDYHPYHAFAVVGRMSYDVKHC